MAYPLFPDVYLKNDSKSAKRPTNGIVTKLSQHKGQISWSSSKSDDYIFKLNLEEEIMIVIFFHVYVLISQSPYL